jgi:hypothetical protein
VLLQEAQRQAVLLAQAAAQIYELEIEPPSDATIENEWAAWGATIDAQLEAALAIALAGDWDLLLGDEQHAGVLTPVPIVREGARWLAFVMAQAWGAVTTQATQRQGTQFVKQAIAAIDERTTDCCLRVSGQTQPLDKPFRLEGTPRFADQMMYPGFHWYCRTGTALVMAQDANDDLTERMQAAAQAELDARARSKTRVEIHPASSTSRR